MDDLQSTWALIAFSSLVLSLILELNQSINLSSTVESEAMLEIEDAAVLDSDGSPLLDTLALFENCLYTYRISLPSSILSEDVEYWVKPRSTVWFSRFLVQQYDNKRWISMFRMTKEAVFRLSDLLRPIVEKRNTNYRLAIPVLIRVACTLFKLTHSANLHVCSEMFAMGRSTVCKVLREVVHALNDTLRHEISWPTGERLKRTQEKFAHLCSLPAVVGAIDCMHISIKKLDFGASDYYYFKTGGYSMNCQAVVDSDKRFLDLFVGMPGSTNDSRMLRRSSLYHLATDGTLMDATYSMDGHTPYLIGDLGYPLLLWLMVPHRGGHPLSVSEMLFNQRLRKGRAIVENAFGILKQTFRELQGKSEFHIPFLPDVIACCALLHNLLLRQSHEEVENLLAILQSEGLNANEDQDHGGPPKRVTLQVEDRPTTLASEKRSALGVFLTTRRRASETYL